MEVEPLVTQTQDFRERDASFAKLEALREAYYRKDIPVPDGFELLNDTVTATVGTSIFQCMEFPAGSDNGIAVAFGRPALWTNGKVKTGYLWATDDTDTTVIRWNVIIHGWSGSAQTVIRNTNQDLTPSGTANQFAWQTMITESTPFTSTYDAIGLRIRRDGGTDVNADEGRIMAVYMQFLPIHRQ